MDPDRGARPVAHLAARMAPGGIETLILDLARRAPDQTAIFSLDGSTEGLRAEWPALRAFGDALHGFERPERFSPEMARRVAKRLRALQVETLYLHNLSPLLYGAWAARLAGVGRVAYVVHDDWHLAQSRKHKAITAWMLRLNPKIQIIAVSDQIAATMRSIAPRAQVAVAPPGVDFARFRPGDRAAARRLIDVGDDAPLIGSVGRVAAVKGFDVLVDALAILGGEARAVIVGDGPERAALESRARDAGLGERFRILGFRDDVHDVLPAFDMLCLPSRNEGLPRIVMEAQACDLPIVATDVGAVRGALCPDTSEVVAPENPAALAAALGRRLAAQPIGGRARAFAAEKFDFAIAAAVFDAVAGREPEPAAILECAP